MRKGKRHVRAGDNVQTPKGCGTVHADPTYSPKSRGYVVRVKIGDRVMVFNLSDIESAL